MNQAILFNDDLVFNQEKNVWCMTGLQAGELITIYFHSPNLKHLASIDQCTKYDLEEITELWLEKNEPEHGEIHIYDI
ncbi:hypothetical protein [Thalassotalea hakodatensis]|uniref:hypothetical protein n=1 Tax=Thalassotalea hakodatensis TaxID=3030492 RepID=UPI00257309FC|nr:hypothetical protein [Thalassotalea hakodatensis]